MARRHVAYTVAAGATPALPAIDAQIVADETPYEILDGRLQRVASAKPPHATRHAQVAAVLQYHAAPGYLTAVDMLARVAPDSDLAPDASIYPDGLDPATGGRRLEALVVEVTGRQSFALLTRKAARFAARGVRRIFCVRVRQGEVLEWEHAASRWAPVALDGAITDACLVRPLPVRALFDAAVAGDAVARALHASGNPVLRELEDAAEARGEARGAARAILTVLAARGLAVGDATRATIEACTDAATLDRWLRRATTAARADDVVRATRKRPRRAT